MPHYTTAKGGVCADPGHGAGQLGEWGINVNCMTPGLDDERGVSDGKSASGVKRAWISVASSSSKPQRISSARRSSWRVLIAIYDRTIARRRGRAIMHYPDFSPGVHVAR